jgi:hypothetical protein
MDMHVGMLIGAIIAVVIIYPMNIDSTGNPIQLLIQAIVRIVCVIIFMISIGGLIGHALS